MADGRASLQRHIERVRQLGNLVRDVTPAVADAVRHELETNITRGVAPDGTRWAPTRDGRTPLRGAAEALRVGAIGTTVIARITGAEARHHLGTARGGIKRQILPTKAMPAPIARAIDAVVTRAFRRTMGGA